MSSRFYWTSLQKFYFDCTIIYRKHLINPSPLAFTFVPQTTKKWTKLSFINIFVPLGKSSMVGYKDFISFLTQRAWRLSFLYLTFTIVLSLSYRRWHNWKFFPLNINPKFAKTRETAASREPLGIEIRILTTVIFL